MSGTRTIISPSGSPARIGAGTGVRSTTSRVIASRAEAGISSRASAPATSPTPGAAPSQTSASPSGSPVRATSTDWNWRNAQLRMRAVSSARACSDSSPETTTTTRRSPITADPEMP